MAFLVMTNTFVNNTTSDATAVNTNFQDIVDACSDGTIDFTVADISCIDFSSTGTTTVGNTSGDDLVVNARLASSLIPKTTNTYALGSTSLGYSGAYLGANSQVVGVLPSSSMSATWNLTLPVSAGSAGDVMQNMGSGVVAWLPAASQEYLSNCSITASVSGNALTIAIKDSAGSDPSSTSPVGVYFRNATLTTGTNSLVQLTSAANLVISSGSTLGHISAQQDYVYVYAINNSGAIELAASSTLFDDGAVYSTTAEGGAGAADSRSTLYSTTARASKAIRLIGRLLSSQSTAGTWATAMAEITSGRSFVDSGMDDIHASKFGFKVYSHGTSYNGAVAPTVTSSQSGFTCNFADFYVYQRSDGKYVLKYNIDYSYSGSSHSTANLTINGATFANKGSQGWSGAFSQANSATLMGTCSAVKNTSIVNYYMNAAQSGLIAAVNGEAELASKPTWAY